MTGRESPPAPAAHPLRDARVDAYLARLPPEQRALLERLRERAHELVPDLGETISYTIPALTRNGRPFLWFAGWKAHCSVYPVGEDVATRYAGALAGYRRTKGSVHFTVDRPLPDEVLVALVARGGTER